MKRWVFLSTLLFVSTAQAEPYVLWNQLLKGQGGSQFSAVADLVEKTSERETVLLKDCEKVYGKALWSDIAYTRSGSTVYAHQDFSCVRSERVGDVPADTGAMMEPSLWTLSRQ